MRWFFIPLLLLLAGSVQAAYTPSADIQAFGARCDGTADDGAKINAALSSNFAVIWGPDSKTCRSTVPINIPWGKTLRSDNPSSRGNGSGYPGGFTIQCDASVNPCVRMHGAMVNVAVTRPFGAAHVPGAVGVSINEQMTLLENVAVWNSAIGIQMGVKDYTGSPPSGLPAWNNGSLGAYLTRVSICGSSDTFLLYGSMAESRWDQVRFGCNQNGLDVNANNFIKVIDPDGTGWPNTLNVANSQFNISSTVPGTKVGCFLRFQGPFHTEPEGWSFTNIHVETHESGVCSDSATPQINFLSIANSDFWGGFGIFDSEFFNLNAATTLDRVLITNSEFKEHGHYTLSPAVARPASDIKISNSRFDTKSEMAGSTDFLGFWFNAVPGSRLHMSNNRIGRIILRGDFGKATPKPGGAVITGTLGTVIDNQATGAVSVDVPVYGTSNFCTLAFLLGGIDPVGMTYGSRQCFWQRHGDQITVSFIISITNKGSSTGNVSIIGLPYRVSGFGAGSTPLLAGNLTGLTGPLIASGVGSDIQMLLVQGSSTGSAAINSTNLTNTTSLQGTLVYTTVSGD